VTRPGSIMKCPNCDTEMQLQKYARIKQTFKEETFYVNTPAFVCNACSVQGTNDEQADELRRVVETAYRSNHPTYDSRLLSRLGELSDREVPTFRPEARC